MSCSFQSEDVESNGISDGEKLKYCEYLMLDKVLNAQCMLSKGSGGHVARDEHLFIIIHQTYELWFKEIIYELDFVREDIKSEHFKPQELIKRLNRIVMILKILVDQMQVLETMTAMDFNEFRSLLGPASGFQSLQFRVLEHKLGLRPWNRIGKFSQQYAHVFHEDKNAQEQLQNSLSESSLLQLVDEWLASMPDLDTFWSQYASSIPYILSPGRREMFASVFDAQLHDALRTRGDRKLSHRAFQAAIIVTQYKNHPSFAAHHQILMLLVDMDEMISKWRFNHLMLVQRMIGTSQFGTGGSSGYQYLRSTLSDRYKAFVDICNVAAFLLPKHGNFTAIASPQNENKWKLLEQCNGKDDAWLRTNGTKGDKDMGKS